jgi:GT2 family glycosyltransferase
MQSDQHAEKNRTFQAITGAVAITTADLYRQTFTNKNGNLGMDEGYNWAFDDTDMSLSIKYNLGKQIVYCGQTNISHEESASLKKNPVNKMFLKHNLQYFFNKWGGRYQIDQDIYMKNPNHNLYYPPKTI